MLITLLIIFLVVCLLFALGCKALIDAEQSRRDLEDDWDSYRSYKNKKSV